MKIWIDATNSPHVNFFAGLIRELEGDHEVVITARPLANTIELLTQQGFEFEVVGRHYGKSGIAKIGGFPRRCAALYRFLRPRGIDAAISQSSFYSPPVARALGIPSIYLNDNEHAEGNRLAFACADKIMVPEFLQDAALRRQWARLAKVTRYPGVKEGIYLWPLADEAPATHGDDQFIIVRPEPWTAQYYRGGRNILDALLLSLSEISKVMLLPRGADQAEHYRSERFANIVIPETPITLADFMRSCRLFIGAGGTMTREAAVLGIPTISIYQDELLSVDRFLVECGAMIHNPRADVGFVKDYLAERHARSPDRNLLRKGRDAYDLIKHTLLEIGPRTH